MFESLEPRIFLSASVLSPDNPQFIFNDANGDQVTVQLIGEGNIEVTLTDDAANNADIETIQISGTNETSQLHITGTGEDLFTGNIFAWSSPIDLTVDSGPADLILEEFFLFAGEALFSSDSDGGITLPGGNYGHLRTSITLAASVNIAANDVLFFAGSTDTPVATAAAILSPDNPNFTFNDGNGDEVTIEHFGRGWIVVELEGQANDNADIAAIHTVSPDPDATLRISTSGSDLNWDDLLLKQWNGRLDIESSASTLSVEPPQLEMVAFETASISISESSLFPNPGGSVLLQGFGTDDLDVHLNAGPHPSQDPIDGLYEIFSQSMSGSIRIEPLSVILGALPQYQDTFVQRIAGNGIGMIIADPVEQAQAPEDNDNGGGVIIGGGGGGGVTLNSFGNAAVTITAGQGDTFGGVLVGNNEPNTNQQSETTEPDPNAFQFIDANGDEVTVRMTGSGTAELRLEGSATNNADLSRIILNDTDETTTLTVTVVQKGNGDGKTTVSTITGTGSLRSASLRNVTLDREGIVLDGSLSQLFADGFIDGADVITGEASSLAMLVMIDSMTGTGSNTAEFRTPGDVSLFMTSGALTFSDINIGGDLTTFLPRGAMENTSVDVDGSLQTLILPADLNSVVYNIAGNLGLFLAQGDVNTVDIHVGGNAIGIYVFGQTDGLIVQVAGNVTSLLFFDDTANVALNIGGQVTIFMVLGDGANIGATVSGDLLTAMVMGDIDGLDIDTGGNVNTVMGFGAANNVDINSGGTILTAMFFGNSNNVAVHATTNLQTVLLMGPSNNVTLDVAQGGIGLILALGQSTKMTVNTFTDVGNALLLGAVQDATFNVGRELRNILVIGDINNLQIAAGLPVTNRLFLNGNHVGINITPA